MIALGTSKPCIVSKISVPVPVYALPALNPEDKFSHDGAHILFPKGGAHVFYNAN